MLLLNFYVPRSHAEKVKQAIFEAGGGKIGNYDCCSFEIQGVGKFRPLKGSKPFQGKVEQIEKVPELKIEIFCQENVLDRALEALREAHPYETPVYYLIRGVG